MLRRRLDHHFIVHGHRALSLCLVLLLFGICSCAGNRARYRVPPESDVPARQVLKNVPFFPQDAYQCGPAALSMTLVWSGLDVSPPELTAAVYTPSRKGSIQPAMIAASRRFGRVAYVISSPEELIREVAHGHPVIVLQNLGLSWHPVWHYAVVIGYDLEADAVLLHSGEESAKKVPLRVFNHTWSRSDFWGMMTLPPERIPATATEGAYLEAVLGLERARRWQAAAAAYRTALERWPVSLAAGIGLGNMHYTMGDLAAAEKAFREVVRHSPGSGAAHNNLAQVLWEQGKVPEALAAARTAVRLGGPMTHLYQQTLDEIQSGP